MVAAGRAATIACAIAARSAACESQPHIFVAWEPLLVLLKQTCHLAVVFLVQLVYSGLLHLLATHTHARFAIKSAASIMSWPGMASTSSTVMHVQQQIKVHRVALLVSA